MIYVVVKVDYDYFRFQENLGAVTSLSEARKIAKNANDNRIPFEQILPIYEYPEDSDRCKQLNEFEERHFWIQKFK